MPERVAYHVELSGAVQGIGLRPAVARLAIAHGLAGWVSNGSRGVRVVVEGLPQPFKEFLRRLPDCLPCSAELRQLKVIEALVENLNGFEIRSCDAGEEAPSTLVPRDVVVCEECLAEVGTPDNRRAQYPFTSCAKCGPRFSLVTTMPFERDQTEMASFPMCGRCRAEYLNPANRRFHAQTIACPDCGPNIWATDRTGQTVVRCAAAVATAVVCLRKGGIVALRGIGGYQLLCDATNEQAVVMLRGRKHRRSKPFAVMVETLDEAEQLAEIDCVGRQALTSRANPIVLLPVRSSSGLANGIHPGLTTIGLFLPTSPLHWLLVRDGRRPLVVTSGNVEGRPLESTPDSAPKALLDIADLWLHHDRPIRHALDDSVVRVIAGRSVTFRVGRGLAPQPLSIAGSDERHVFAAGGHQKAAFACFNGGQSVLGPHIGDLDGLETRARYDQQASQINSLYQVQPELWVHDLHPDYFTTRWSEAQSGRQIGVQHHHAHIVAGMLEQGWLDREVLGVACDGTGYGPDGTIWGGEFLRTTTRGYQRVAYFRTFPLLGGDQAIREPLRVAIALAHQSVSLQHYECGLSLIEQQAVLKFKVLLENPRLSTHTSSVGRLFDGVAALVMGVTLAGFEGQLAQLLESICDVSETQSYTFAVDHNSVLQIDWRPVIRQILVDRASGASPGSMAMRFHRGLAQVIAATCGQFRDLPVVLGGGVFQNRLLVELLVESLARHPQPVGLPGMIPPNDGGLAAGQLAIGMMMSNHN